MKELLPLGSVVRLKGATRRIMIVGRLQNLKNQPELYDYAAVLYPEGLIDSEHFYVFNQEDIDCLFFIGLQDVEEFNYRFELEKHMPS
ncbi:MAG: DUF4176 domain-containing protein [Floccifex sp.]